MIDLERRLTELGDRLDLDDDPDALAASVLARVDDPTVGGGPWTGRAPLRVAAAVVLVVAIAVIAIPGPRRTVSGWFGFDRARVDQRPDASAPGAADAFDLPLPGDTRILEVDGAEVMITTINGRFDDDFLTKTLGGTTSVQHVDIDGERGLWISGDPHEVLYESGGEAVVVRVAGNTLLWQDGDVLRRIEGFDDLDAAIAFAAGLG